LTSTVGELFRVRNDAPNVGRIMSGEGIDVLTQTEILRVQGKSGDNVEVLLRSSAAGERTVTGSDILVAVGRVPNTAGIGLDVAGVALDARGYIKVNERLETGAPEVWAIGDDGMLATEEGSIYCSIALSDPLSTAPPRGGP